MSASVILSEAKGLRRGAEILRSDPPVDFRSWFGIAQNDRGGEGSVRIEDMVVIENGKARVMSHAPNVGTP